MDEESISESGGLTGNWNGPRLASEAEVDEIDFDKIVDVDADDEGEVSQHVFTIFFEWLATCFFEMTNLCEFSSTIYRDSPVSAVSISAVYKQH